MLSEFHSRGKFHKEISATFICLIPIAPNPAILKDFKPISFVGCIYKLLSNILANRLKKVIPLIVSPYQGDFVPGRQMLGGILIAK